MFGRLKTRLTQAIVVVSYGFQVTAVAWVFVWVRGLERQTVATSDSEARI